MGTAAARDHRYPVTGPHGVHPFAQCRDDTRVIRAQDMRPLEVTAEGIEHMGEVLVRLQELAGNEEPDMWYAAQKESTP